MRDVGTVYIKYDWLMHQVYITEREHMKYARALLTDMVNVASLSVILIPRIAQTRAARTAWVGIGTALDLTDRHPGLAGLQLARDHSNHLKQLP